MWYVSVFSETLRAMLTDSPRLPAIRRSTPSERFFFYYFFSSSACSSFSSSSLSVRRLLRLRLPLTLLAHLERPSFSQILYGLMVKTSGRMVYHHEWNPGALFSYVFKDTQVI